MSELRQRYAPVTTEVYPGSTLSANEQASSRKSKMDSLSASYLLKSNPTHSGQVMKLDVPAFYSMMPTFVQRILRYFPSPFRPSWKKRYMIQIGKYLYRYQIDSNLGAVGAAERSRMKLKGTPIPLSTVLIKPLVQTTYGLQTASHEDIIAFSSDLPPFCSGFFSITSEGETRYYAVSSMEDANTWINSLRQGRQANIELSMGHDKRPYPENWRYIDAMGDERVRRNNRVKDLVKNTERREMEIMQYMDGGLSANRGHFG